MARESNTLDVASDKAVSTERQIPDRYNGVIIAVDDGAGNSVPEAEITVCVRAENKDWIPIHKELVRDMPEGRLGVTLDAVPEQIRVEVKNTGTTEQTLRVTTIPIL